MESTSLPVVQVEKFLRDFSFGSINFKNIFARLHVGSLRSGSLWEFFSVPTPNICWFRNLVVRVSRELSKRHQVS